MAQLTMTAGPDQGSVYTLTGEETTLGRHPDNDIPITDSASSRHHAKVIRRGEQFYLLDLGSTHGTFVNEVRNNQELLLSDHDRIRIGNTEIVFRSKLRVGDPGAKASTEPPGERTAPQTVNLPGDTVAFSVPADTGGLGRGLTDQHAERLSRVANAIQSVFDIDQLLGTLMDMIIDAFGPERGVVLLFDDTTGSLLPRVTRPARADTHVSQTVIDYTVEHRSSLLVSDMASDQRFSDAESVMAQAIRSAICSPLVSKDRVLGVLYIDAQSREISYRREDLALLNIIAANAAIAIENAQLVQQKVEAERLAAMGVAVAGISHYAKNILAGIIGASSLIDEAITRDDLNIVREAWPILQRSNKKITGLIKDMLSYSKPREPHLVDGNLNELLREIHGNQAPRAEEIGVELAMELDDAIPTSQFDHEGIHDTLLNIVGNAIEACESVNGAKVTVRSARADDGMLHVWIIDNGMGIPPEIVARIFEPFFSTKGSKGTGLGLAVARKTIEEHHGELRLDSQPGAGTTFEVILPAEPPTTTAA